MKTTEWMRLLESQLRQEGKKLFSVTELGNIAGTSLRYLNVALARLVRQGVLVRYGQGAYGLPGAVSPEDLVPALDAGAYITGLYALYRHNRVTQVPVEITCFTDRRHNRSRVRSTPLGRFVLTCTRKPVYAPPEDGVVASPEQALYDFVFLSCRNGVHAESQATFRRLSDMDRSVLRNLATRYPGSVSGRVKDMLVSGR